MPIIPIRRSVSLSAIRFRCNTLLGLLASVIVGCLISACSLTLKPSPVLESVAELPDEFADSEVAGSYEPLEWWKAFADPVLDQVIEAVLDLELRPGRGGCPGRPGQGAGSVSSKPRRFRCFSLRLEIADMETSTNAGIAAYLDELGVSSVTVYRDFGFEIPDRIGLTTYSTWRLDILLRT